MARRVMEQLRGVVSGPALLNGSARCTARGLKSGGSFATDGGALYYHRMAAGHLPQKPPLPAPAYLHSLFHCIFRHLWLRDKRDPDLWGLACDIAVEATLDTLNTPATKRPVAGCGSNATAAREVQILAAGPIYRVLAQTDAETLNKWQREFYTDSHRLWPADPTSPRPRCAANSGRTWAVRRS